MLKRPMSSIAEAKNYALINLLSGSGKAVVPRSGGRKCKIAKKMRTATLT